MKRIVLIRALSIVALCGGSPCSGEAPTTQPATQEALVDLGFGYRRSDAYVWFKGRRIDGTGRHDIDRFAQAVGHPLKLAMAIDAPSFVAISEQYTKDKDKVYYKWISPGRFWIVDLEGADPVTFEALDHQLARDRNTVWRSDRPFAGADPTTAEVVNPNFVWKDKDSVFYQSKKIVGPTRRHFGTSIKPSTAMRRTSTGVMSDSTTPTRTRSRRSETSRPTPATPDACGLEVRLWKASMLRRSDWCTNTSISTRQRFMLPVARWSEPTRPRSRSSAGSPTRTTRRK